MSKAAGHQKQSQSTVVYLDDQRWLLPLADRLLSEGGYRCRGYLDPHEVLELVKNGTERVDLIVTDQNMSGMTGVAFTERIKALRPDLPVAMISGHLPEELRAAATAAGVSAFIFKPALSTELLRVVDELLTAGGTPPPVCDRAQRRPRPRRDRTASRKPPPRV